MKSTKIATCYKPNDANNVPSRYRLLLEENDGMFDLVEILDHVGTGTVLRFSSEAKAITHAASFGYTEVLRA